jgi:hypothetical protein
MPYYTIFSREPSSLWFPQFGDHDREVVEAERKDYVRHRDDWGIWPKGTQFLIIPLRNASLGCLRDKVTQLNGGVR